MKWIRPGVRSLPPRKCEFCGSDVETPYKGVHDETEMINGFPVKCRNNGRLNVLACRIGWLIIDLFFGVREND